VLAPALPSRAPLGHFGHFRRDPLGLLTRAAGMGSDLVRIRMGPWWWTLAATPADATRLPLTSAVIDEAMRLYPPGWAFDRQAVDEDAIAGFRVPAGALVVVSPWVVHRDPRVWERPEEFDPTRFAPEQAAGRLRFAYFPFGGGPRICIGEELALVEARLILATTLRRFRLRRAPGWKIAADPSVTLRPRHGVRVLLDRT